MKARSMFLAAIAASGLALASCASAPISIPDSLSAMELVQRAQEASDTYSYDIAISYYKALAERFGSDPAIQCEADYELAFIAYKQGKLPEAKAALEALLERFKAPEGSSLPQSYKVLAEKVLAKISDQAGGTK